MIQKLPIINALACFSILLSAVYNINISIKIWFTGLFSRFFGSIISSLHKHKICILFIFVTLTIIFDIYLSSFLNNLDYNISYLIYQV